jgi:hypothetical protein
VLPEQVLGVDVGTIVAAATAVAFYVRLVRAQKRLFKGAGSQDRPSLIRRWPLFAVGTALVVAGAFVAAGVLGPAAKPWWWIPVSAGFAVLAFSV